MDILEIVEHVISHSVEDTLYLIPFLFVTYVAMEWLEHKTATRTQDAIRRAGAVGPVIGAVLGAVPQCGFSASAATLYAGRVVTIGTLFAVFLSTSDEMLPIFIAEQVPLSTIASIIGAKIVVGCVAGLLIDAVVRVTRPRRDDLRIHELCAAAHCGCEHDCETCRQNPKRIYDHLDDARVTAELAEGGGEPHAPTHDHTHDHEHGWKDIFKSALIHTLKITVFVFVVTLILNIFFETVGEEALGQVLGGDSIISIAATALVGLIPNCAASLVIAQLYVEGVLGPGAMLAGLAVSAGIGLLVLVKTNRNAKQNAAIIAGLYAIGLVAGVVCALTGLTF